MNEQQNEQQSGEKSKSERITLWIILLLGIIAITIGIFKFSGKQSTTSTAIAPTPSVLTITNKDWVTGNSKSPIVLIEYADFQCPACGYYYKITKQISKEFGTKIAIVYRNFPLRQLHQNAQMAAQAAGAAGLQSKFWDMHDMIFENQQTWSDQKNAEETFVGYAKNLGLDVDKFKTDINSKEVKDKISSDYKNGIKAGVNYTPTFFLNNKKIENPRTYEGFKNILNEAINKNNS